ncbi:hypothetical protein PQX77_009366 [Marasmius sp. AFHP31]|nr:hypothetical protein PQX77_009366 [Marasmius sp. AFHP31]
MALPTRSNSSKRQRENDETQYLANRPGGTLSSANKVTIGPFNEELENEEATDLSKNELYGFSQPEEWNWDAPMNTLDQVWATFLKKHIVEDL